MTPELELLIRNYAVQIVIAFAGVIGLIALAFGWFINRHMNMVEKAVGASTTSTHQVQDSVTKLQALFTAYASKANQDHMALLEKFYALKAELAPVAASSAAAAKAVAELSGGLDVIRKNQTDTSNVVRDLSKMLKRVFEIFEADPRASDILTQMRAERGKG